MCAGIFSFPPVVSTLRVFFSYSFLNQKRQKKKSRGQFEEPETNKSGSWKDRLDGGIIRQCKSIHIPIQQKKERNGYFRNEKKWTRLQKTVGLSRISRNSCYSPRPRKCMDNEVQRKKKKASRCVCCYVTIFAKRFLLKLRTAYLRRSKELFQVNEKTTAGSSPFCFNYFCDVVGWSVWKYFG